MTVYGFTAIAIRQLSTQGIQPAVHPLVVFRHCLAIVHINHKTPSHKLERLYASGTHINSGFWIGDFRLPIPEFARLPAIESVAVFLRIDISGCKERRAIAPLAGAEKTEPKRCLHLLTIALHSFT
ncbi:hypothetical protein [Thermoleptolyngbya sp.]